MRKILYVIILALLMAAPVQKLDVAQLEPVEVVHLSKEGNQITLTTDTKAKGEGTTVRKALEDLKSKTAGVVYLDTAQYLLLDSAAIKEIDEMRQLLKDSVKLCIAQDPDMENAAKYLETHGNLPNLKSWKQGMTLPIWKNEKNIKKSENNA